MLCVCTWEIINSEQQKKKKTIMQSRMEIENARFVESRALILMVLTVKLSSST